MIYESHKKVQKNPLISYRTEDSLMQLGLDCHFSAAPHSYQPFHKNREALMALLSYKVQGPGKPTDFIHYSKQGLSHKTKTQVPSNFLRTTTVCLLLCLLVLHIWLLLICLPVCVSSFIHIRL